MVESRIYSVLVNQNNQHKFYGTFSNRKNMLDSIRKELDLSGAYIQGATKKLAITPVTICNGFNGYGLTIFKDDLDGTKQWYIKVLMYQMNSLNPYFSKH